MHKIPSPWKSLYLQRWLKPSLYLLNCCIICKGFEVTVFVAGLQLTILLCLRYWDMYVHVVLFYNMKYQTAKESYVAFTNKTKIRIRYNRKPSRGRYRKPQGSTHEEFFSVNKGRDALLPFFFLFCFFTLVFLFPLVYFSLYCRALLSQHSLA